MHDAEQSERAMRLALGQKDVPIFSDHYSIFSKKQEPWQQVPLDLDKIREYNEARGEEARVKAQIDIAKVCAVCEERPKAEDDYLCRECRLGEG
jgi:hypothetical protein